MAFSWVLVLTNWLIKEIKPKKLFGFIENRSYLFWTISFFWPPFAQRKKVRCVKNPVYDLFYFAFNALSEYTNNFHENSKSQLYIWDFILFDLIDFPNGFFSEPTRQVTNVGNLWECYMEKNIGIKMIFLRLF